MTAFTIRPAWTPTTVILTIVGFLLFWPLGLAMLAYVIWGDRLAPDFDRVRARFSGLGGLRAGGATGNTAFDEYRAGVLKRLREERRQIDDERREFEAFLRTLARARDKEEFDRFMSERRRRTADDQPMAA